MAKGIKTGGRNIKKGQVLNPNGRPKTAKETKLIRQTLTDDVVKTTEHYLSMSKEDLEKAKRDKTKPSLELIVINIISKSIEQGDNSRLSGLLDRVIGRVKQEMDLTVDGGLEFNFNIPRPKRKKDD
ncbi:MAG: hypothetical protein GY861_08300 [bacterium]|nr:hypothetical protein [bacterium]